MITLSTSEAAAALDALMKSTTDTSFLTEKLTSGKESTNSYELSEDEVELLMDLLPPPSDTDAKNRPHENPQTTLRSTLLQFLLHLRSR